MKSFDFYEFTGVLLPGSVFALGAAILFPTIGNVLLNGNLSVGDLGLFVMVSYASGHLVQAFGNLLENLWWKLWGGMPTQWIRQRKRDLLSDQQVDALFKAIPTKCGLGTILKPEEMNPRQWHAVTRQVYAAVSAETRSARIDTFNGNYGLNRGLASALLVDLILIVITGNARWGTVTILLIASAAAMYRMHRFAVHYGRELFIQFLQLTADQTG
jgi:hypothetical protein